MQLTRMWLGALACFACAAASAAERPTYYLGADLSYVNELEDCGATYSDQKGQRRERGGSSRRDGLRPHRHQLLQKMVEAKSERAR
jgi:arabinogalactan endo-1,4-beta-galactosidase